MGRPISEFWLKLDKPGAHTTQNRGHSQVPRIHFNQWTATERISAVELPKHRMDVKGQYVVVVVLFSPSIPN